ncbi:hypothetical protein [Aquimarina sp. AU119]|uniref:hypothetical protein n=1 Tax=Aquimarina sp. AU119 TaxID=2108528 RepID=UPI000D68C346|nr:hypothetical protein [Aquimarina sp. AU119]
MKEILYKIKRSTKIFPVLKPSTILSEDYSDSLYLLEYNTSGGNPAFVVTYSYDIESLKVTINEASEMFNRNLTEIQEISIKNLNALKIKFEYFISNQEILTVNECEYSNEIFMSEKLMLEAHKKLNANEIFISIARKGSIFITSNPNEEFLKLHWNIWFDNDTSKNRITNRVLVLEKGKFVSFLDWDETHLDKETYCRLYLEGEANLRKEYGEGVYFSKPQVLEYDSEIITITPWANFIGYPVILPFYDFIDKIILTATDMLTAKDNIPTTTENFDRNLKDVVLALFEIEQTEGIEVYADQDSHIPFVLIYAGFDSQKSNNIEKIIRDLPENNI